MPPAARVGDQTTHGGVVTGPGAPQVMVGGMPAAVSGDIHICPVPQPHPPSAFALGSATVSIGGRAALRTGDVAGCGAAIAVGLPSVLIGG
jgi:uncharacterized Zn-binding protein involved in type VI secretion